MVVRSPGRDIPFAQRTLPALLQWRVRRAADRPLVRFGSEQRTAAQVCDRVARFAGTLAGAEVQPGDRVAMLCSNHFEMFDAMLACTWMGAVAVPVNTAARGPQLEHVLTNAGPRLLLIDGDLVERLDVVQGAVGSLERIWTVGEDAGRTQWHGAAIEPLPAPGEPLEAHPVTPADMAAILYTSGTTGPPKGVCCPHGQFYWWGVLVGEQLGMREGDVAYTVLPLFHTNALNGFVQALINDTTFAFGLRFSASRFWSEVRAVDASVTYLLGAMVHILLKQPPAPVERAHRVRIALSPATPAEAVVEARERFGVELMDGYGSTETNLVTATTFGGPPGSMGVAAPEFEARVVDACDNELPPGTPGELVVRHREPFSMATGYFRLDDKTVEAWRNLWFHTGDRVLRDAGGAFFFVDRLNDAIRRRGENISSFEVEQALLSHRAVAAVAVVPVPSELSEDEVMAFVVPADGPAPDPVELVGHCEPRLAYFAIPRYVELVDELPLTQNGKVRKNVLRQRGTGQRTWDREAAGYQLPR